MAAYRRVYDSHHLQADCQEPGLALEDRNPTLGNRVWATFYLYYLYSVYSTGIERLFTRFLRNCVVLTATGATLENNKPVPGPGGNAGGGNMMMTYDDDNNINRC